MLLPYSHNCVTTQFTWQYGAWGEESQIQTTKKTANIIQKASQSSAEYGTSDRWLLLRLTTNSNSHRLVPIALHCWYAGWAVWDAVWGPTIMLAFVCPVLVVLAAFWAIWLYHYTYIDIYMIIMRLWRRVIIPSRLLYVSHVCIDPVGSHAPHQLLIQAGQLLRCECIMQASKPS